MIYSRPPMSIKVFPQMSKSIGNVVDPQQLMDLVTEDGLRYYLLREGGPNSDNNFSLAALTQLLNLELADTLGNLLARCTSARVNPSQVRAPPSHCSCPGAAALLDQLAGLPDRVGEQYSQFQFQHGLVEVMAALRATNQLVQVLNSS